jgi:imidazolonepropionase-like amidohydrolase
MTQRLVALLSVALLVPPVAASGAPHVLAVRCGTLIADAARPPLHDATIIITDGIITGVGAGLAIPPGAEELDLRAYTVMPGLVDAHSHLWTGPLTSQTVSDPLATLRASRAVAFALDSGVVGMRTVGGQGFIDVAIAAAIDEGTIPGPHIVPGAHAISTPGGHGDFIPLPPSLPLADYYTPVNGFINSPDDAEKAVHLQIKYGARVIKILASGGVASPLDSPLAEQVSPEEMRVIVEQAHMAGLKVAAHAENLKTILDALHAGVDSIEHGSDLDQDAIDFMKAHHIYLVPTVNVVDSIVRMTDARFPEHMIRKGKELAAKHFASFKLALASGVTMAAGSDDFYQPDRPAGLPSEIVTDVKYGMTPQQALVTATTNSAALLGLDALGAIAIGKEGTLIALEGNPLTDVTAVQRVRAVVKAGQVVKHPAPAAR